MSYAAPADFLKRYDYRILGQLVTDTGTAVTPTALLNDPNLQAALDDASGMIDSAVLVSNRYGIADLTALTGQDQAFLLRLTCDLAFVLLQERRGAVDVKDLPQYQATMQTLQWLRNGERIFAVPQNELDGNPTYEFVSVQKYADLDLARDEAGRFFPLRREQQFP